MISVTVDNKNYELEDKDAALVEVLQALTRELSKLRIRING